MYQTSVILNCVYVTPQKLLFLLFSFLLLKANSLLMFLLHPMEHWFILGHSLHFIIPFPCAMSLYLYVLHGDGFFLCLRISLLYHLMFEYHYNTSPWLQLDSYKILVWLFLNLSSMFTFYFTAPLKAFWVSSQKYCWSAVLYEVYIFLPSVPQINEVLLKLRTYLSLCTFHYLSSHS